MRRFNVAVIGLGAIGSAALYQLAQRGMTVIGIDRYDPPHTRGSSHGEARITRQAIGEGEFYVPIAQRSAEIWRELERLSGEELYNACGFMLMADENDYFYQTTVRAAERFGIMHEFLTLRQVQQRFPAIKLNERVTAYFEPKAGFLRPERCIKVQLDFAQAHGAVALTDTLVTEVTENGHGVQMSLDNGEQVLADKAIIAVGSWVGDFVPPEIKNLFTVYLQTKYWVTFEQKYRSYLTPDRLPVCSWKTRPNGELDECMTFPLVELNSGINFSAHDAPLTGYSGGEFDFTVAEPKLFYQRVVNYLRFVHPELLWSTKCRYTVTPDEEFIIDWLPDSARIVLASPCSGHGFKHSAAVGEILAQLVSCGDTKLDISRFALSRFANFD